jgi:UDP-3-O-[3-hydroxymyristoyl] glucosamine N-acyltransferase
MELIKHKTNASTPQSLTLGALAEKTNTRLQGSPDVVINGVGTISNATSGQISFIAGLKYRHYLGTTKASAVILPPSEAENCPVAALITPDPKYVFAVVTQLLHPYQSVKPGLHSTAVIGEGCDIHPQTYIGPHCVIGNRVKIGANVILEANCYIGDDCVIQDGTVFYPHVTLYQGCKIGRDCVFHAGVVIGSDGFGYAKNRERWLKVPQIAAVKVGDRVEIGANTTIDRGAIEDTQIENDVILDNLIQIGHNVKVGQGTAISALTGIAGSTTIGKHCLIGGATAINGHIALADQVNIVAASSVPQSITEPGTYASAVTVTDIKVWKKNLVRFHQLNDLAVRLKEIENKLKAQEELNGVIR